MSDLIGLPSPPTLLSHALPTSVLVRAFSPLKAAVLFLCGIATFITVTGCTSAEPTNHAFEKQTSSSTSEASSNMQDDDTEVSLSLLRREKSSAAKMPVASSMDGQEEGQILSVGTEQGEDVDCSEIIGMTGQCDYQTIEYKGNSGDDAGRHFDAVGLTVFVIEGREMSKQAFLDYLLKMYGNPPEKKVFSGKNFYQYAEGTPAMRAEEPGGADEGMFWTSGEKFILIHHNGIDGDTAEGEKSHMYLSLLLEKYMKIYPSDLE